MTDASIQPPRRPKGATPERARRLALLRTVRDLRTSVDHGRPVTLPNLVRLLQRRLSHVTPGLPADAPIDHLRKWYQTHQPFNRSRIRWRV